MVGLVSGLFDLIRIVLVVVELGVVLVAHVVVVAVAHLIIF